MPDHNGGPRASATPLPLWRGVFSAEKVRGALGLTNIVNESGVLIILKIKTLSTNFKRQGK